MDSIGSLKLEDEKLEKMGSLCGQVHTNAYSILEFCSEWEGLNDHLRTVKECLVERGKRVDLREKQLEEKEEQLRRWSEEVESKSKCVDEKIREFEAMERDRGLVEREIEECNLQLLCKEIELALTRKELGECSEEPSAKGQQLAGVQKSLEGSRTELQDKEIQLVSVGIMLDESKKSLESRKHDLQRTEDLIRHRSKELKSKEKKLDEVQKSMQKKSKELGEEVSRLDSIKELIRENNEELEKKEEQYKSMTSAIEKTSQKRDLAEKELRKIFGSIKESLKNLELRKGHLNSITIDIEEKTKQLKEMESRCNDAHQSFERYAQDAEMKENKLASMDISVKEKMKELELHQNASTSIKGAIKECNDELELKQTELHFVKESVEKVHDKTKAMQAAHRVLEEQENPLTKAVAKYSEERESREKEHDLVRKTLEECQQKLVLTQTELFTRQLENLEDDVYACLLPSIQVKIEKNEPMRASNATNSLPSANFQPDNKTDGRSLSAIISDSRRIMKLMKYEASERFFGLQDPSKEVLDLFRRQGFPADKFRERFQLMKYLMQVLPKVTSEVKDASIPLAKRWKSGMSLEDENPVEAMAFLLFLIVYGVADSFIDRDILELIMMISQSKHAPEICWRLGFGNRMPDFIRLLMQKKRHMEAAMFICSFGLASEFPIEPLLKRFMEKRRMEAWILNYEMNSLKDGYSTCSHDSGSLLPNVSSPWQDWFVDSELEALRAISSFILEFKLDFESVECINEEMAKLENERISTWLRAPTPAPLVSQHAQVQNYRPEATSGFINPQVNPPSYQPDPQSLLQQHQKRPRTDSYSDTCFVPQATEFHESRRRRTLNFKQ